MKTATKRRYFVAVNQYRSSTDHGFANTWRVYECLDAAHQRRILKHGLPVRDVCGIDGTPCYSTMGVRAATPAEIRAAKKAEETDRHAIPQCDHHLDGVDG